MSEYNHIMRSIEKIEADEKASLVERLTSILSERRLPGTRNGPITEPRELAEHIVSALAAGTQSAETSETSAPSEGCQSGDAASSATPKPSQSEGA
jgi:hypothetical protein